MAALILKQPWLWKGAVASLLGRIQVLAFAFAVMGTMHVGARPVQVSEYQLKAVFLFNFAQFVDWPASAFPGPGDPICIGVLGEDPFGRLLDEVVADERAHGRPMIVRRFRTIEEIDGCHILFISGSESGRLEKIIKAIHSRSILTVADISAFASRGGMVEFAMQRNKIRLIINANAAAAAELTVSSMLLRSAQLVNARTN